MNRRPQPEEHSPGMGYYIGLVRSDDVIAEIESQFAEMLALYGQISEEKSLHRYAPGKWSIREAANHVSDTERAFVFRALNFARGLPGPLPGFDQTIAVPASEADQFSWQSQIEDFRAVRQASLTFLRNLPKAAWDRTGVANNNSISVRALAYMIAGHAAHHNTILRERYL